MKKSFVTLAVASALASGAAQAVQVYDKDGTSLAIGGRIQGAYHSKDAVFSSRQPASGDASLNASGRLNITGRTRLAEGVDGISFAEWNVADAEQYSAFNTRFLWVGLDFGSYGRITGGKGHDAFYYVQQPADVWDDYGTLGYMGYNDRRSGNFVYSWSGYGVDVNVSYSTAKQNQTVKGAFLGMGQSLDIEQGVAVALGYTTPDVVFGPISVRLGYGMMQLSDHTDDTGTSYNVASDTVLGTDTVYFDELDQYAISLTWGKRSRGLYINAIYEARIFSLENVTSGGDAEDLEVTGAALSIGYKLENGMGAMIGLEWQSVEYGDYDVSAMVLPIYLTYDVTPNFFVWLEGSFDIGTDDDPGTWNSYYNVTKTRYNHSAFTLGARFKF